MYTKRQKVNIDDTRFIYATNFSGDPGRDRFDNKDSKQYRCRSDHHHQYGIRKMADGHQNGIAKQIFGSVEELCKYRVDP